MDNETECSNGPALLRRNNDDDNEYNQRETGKERTEDEETTGIMVTVTLPLVLVCVTMISISWRRMIEDYDRRDDWSNSRDHYDYND